MKTDGEIDDWVVDITTDHYSPMPDDPDVLAIATQAKLANALQAENERLREALSEIDELTCGIDVSLGSLIDRVWTISSRALSKPTGGTE